KPHSLRAQLVLWTMLPMFVVLVVSAMATYVIAYSVANRAFDYSLQDEARTIAARVHMKGDVPEVSLPSEVREVLEYDSLDKVYYDVRSRQYGALIGRAALPLPDFVPGVEGAFYDGVLEDHSVRLFVLPLSD